MGFQKITLIGNLGNNPEMVLLDNDNQMVKFSLAVSTKVKKGDEYTNHTEWFRCVIFGKRAVAFEKYMQKGSMVHVECVMRTNVVDSDNGEKKYFTSFIVNEFTFLGKKSDEQTESVPQNDKETEINDLPFPEIEPPF